MASRKKADVEKEIVEEKNEQSDSKILMLLRELIPYVIIFVVVVLIRTFIITPIVVSGPSMNPTLDGGELMILNKIAKIDRYDIVVVESGTDDIIKRVIALPGEKITCENNKIYINDHKQEEEYSMGNTCITKEKEFKIQLADDEYFVMGDNRENSADSRLIGPIKKDNIKGTTRLVLYPLKKIGTVK